MKVKPGHEEQAAEAFMRMYSIARGYFGWNGHAKILVELGLDKELGISRGNKRIRRKKMKRALQSVMWQGLMEHCE